MHLAATALRRFWNQEDELLLLGPWCLPYRERAGWKGPRLHYLPCPWDNRPRFQEAYAYVTATYERFLPHLADYLNRTHSLQGSLRFWRILLGPWLFFYLHVFYDRYTLLRDALALHPGLRITGLRRADFVPTVCYEGLDAFCCSHEGNLQFFTQILGAMGVPFAELSLSEDGAPPPPPIPPQPVPSRPFRARLRSWRDRFFPPDIVWGSMYCHPRRLDPVLKQLDARSVFFDTDLLSPPPPIPLRRGPERQGLAVSPQDDEFGRIVAATLPDNFPSLYLEGFGQASRAVAARYPFAPRLLVTNNSWAAHEGFKFHAAAAHEAGARIWSAQHGGGYGVTEIEVWEDHERAVSDRYVTWGWEDGDARLLPLPAINPSCLVAERFGTDREKNPDILFVGTAPSVYLYRLQSTPVGAQWEHYWETACRFLRTLPPSARERLRMRPYMRDNGHAIRDRLNDAAPSLRYDDPVSFSESLASCALVVFDHASTTMLEAMAADVPTLLFEEGITWQVRKGAQADFSSLKEVGIWVGSPEEAAEAVAAIAPDPAAWWAEPRRREARTRFCGKYVRTSPDWAGAWAGALREELATRGSRRRSFSLVPR